VSEQIHNYEQVSIYGLDGDKRDELLVAAAECVFNWSTKDGWPVGVIMSFLWRDGKFWLTAGAHRHRIEAIRRDPRVSVVVTSTGTKLGPSKTITVKGHVRVREDAETKAWFYPALAARVRSGDPAATKQFAEFLDSPLRVILEVTPEKWITYDGEKMALDTAGKLPAERKTKPESSDTQRLAAELKRRGMA
jgi:nitroimidazol reductase NimA-like FMN-containing flavoprotein (pyridoxamine 5'-phosphate oxidase superfamily)